MSRPWTTASARWSPPSGSSARRSRTTGFPRSRCVRLADPLWLLALAGLVLLLPRPGRAARAEAVRYPSLDVLRAVAPAGAGRRRLVLGALRVATLGLLGLALARPQL